MGIVSNNPLRLRGPDDTFLTFASPQEGLAAGLRAYKNLDRDDALRILRDRVRAENGPPPEGTANGDWLDDAVYNAAYSLSRPLSKSRTIRGSLLSGLSALSAVIIEVAQTTLPHAVTAATSVEAVWPQATRALLIAMCVAGAWMSYSARVESRDRGMK